MPFAARRQIPASHGLWFGPRHRHLNATLHMMNETNATPTQPCSAQPHTTLTPSDVGSVRPPLRKQLDSPPPESHPHSSLNANPATPPKCLRPRPDVLRRRSPPSPPPDRTSAAQPGPSHHSPPPCCTLIPPPLQACPAGGFLPSFSAFPFLPLLPPAPDPSPPWEWPYRGGENTSGRTGASLLTSTPRRKGCANACSAVSRSPGSAHTSLATRSTSGPGT